MTSLEIMEVLDGDPELQGRITVQIAYGPFNPFGLGIIQAASDLDVTIQVKLISESPTLNMLQMDFSGKNSDLISVFLRLEDWAAKFPAAQPMSKEEFHARDAVPSTCGPAEGIAGSVVANPPPD